MGVDLSHVIEQPISLQERPSPEPDVRGNYYLLPEGDVSDTTQVPCVITDGPLARVKIYYEPEANIAEPINRSSKPIDSTF